MTKRTSPPYRADHVGSLLRPPELIKAREDHAKDRIDLEELRAIEDDAIRDVVAMQRDVGLQSATDGEFRRASWHMDFIYQLDGISKAPGSLNVEFRNAIGVIEFAPAALHIDGRIGVSKTIFGPDFEYLQSVVTKGVPKLTIPSPSMVHYRGGRAAVDESVYPDLAQFWSDLGENCEDSTLFGRPTRPRRPARPGGVRWPRDAPRWALARRHGTALDRPRRPGCRSSTTCRHRRSSSRPP